VLCFQDRRNCICSVRCHSGVPNASSSMVTNVSKMKESLLSEIWLIVLEACNYNLVLRKLNSNDSTHTCMFCFLFKKIRCSGPSRTPNKILACAPVPVSSRAHFLPWPQVEERPPEKDNGLKLVGHL